MAKAASIGGTDGGSTVPHLIMLLVLHGTGATSAPAADTVAESIVLKAADGIELKIEVSPDTLAYFVSVDGEVWLTSGPVAMTSGGVTYTSDCPDKNNCLSLSGALVKSSGTDVSANACIVARTTRRTLSCLCLSFDTGWLG